MNSFVLGIAGGSGSGKTYFAQRLFEALGPERCALIPQDRFYIDQSAQFDFDGGSVNFDHPSAIDFDLLAEKVQALKSGQATDLPFYDFVTHKRLPQVTRQEPKPILLIDGILILHAPQVRALCDESVFFDTPEALRLERRLRRDVVERGRTQEGVLAQFQQQVKPMHDTFVEPSKQHATTLIRNLQDYERVLQEYIRRLDQPLGG